MCGIAGILNTDGKPVDRDELSALTSSLSHRGPDGNGFHLDGNVGIGHRRLAIIDLEGGAQPIANEDGTVWLTFNGEIYNFEELRSLLIKSGHRFKTKSDSEVLVHAYEQWGVQCLGHLRGMFAFAIWDKPRKRLFLARDRIGIKPVCYYVGAGVFAFASELQAFRFQKNFHPSIDLEALDLYLHFQYIPAPYTIYREVRKLPPAHYLLLEENGETQGPIRYWDLKFQPDHRVKESEWIERIDAGLRDAVRAHLVSDVPFGAFLSGGVDSSIVVAYMSQLLQEPVRTFTAGFDDDEYDERPHARFVSESAGTKHFEELVNFDVFDVLEQMVSHCGEPFADSSIICTYLVSRLARGQVKMVLSGDGGDETFAGYDYYGKMLSQHPLPQGFLRRTRRTLGNWARRAGLRHPLPSARQTWYERTPYFSESQRLKLWRPEFHSTLRHTRLWNDEQFEPIRNADLLSQCQYVDMHNYLPYNNLHKVDIASMCHGLEVRVPFLDHRFLEMVAGIPAEMKWRSREEGGGGTASPQGPMTGKYILKKTAERFFPPEFLYRPKQGFSMPVPSWFAGPLHGELREHLNDSTVGLGEFFDMAYVRSMIEEHHHQKNHGWRLWALLFLAEWNRERKPPDLGRLQAYNNL